MSMEDIISQFPSSPGLSEEQLQYLQGLIDYRQRLYIQKELQESPSKEINLDSLVRTIERSKHECYSYRRVDLAFNKCYANICAGCPDDESIIETVEMIVDKVDERMTLAKGEEIRTAVEQMIFLAARLVKGEACEECKSGYRSPNPGSARLHELVVDGIECIEEIGKDLGLKWSLSAKGVFALNKLCFIFLIYYSSIQYLSLPHYFDYQQYQGIEEGLDESWCHDLEEAPNCHCWDKDSMDLIGGHAKHCALGWKSW
jgi:hypothetical protein